ncbi:MAG: hypothetical protein AABY22_20805 [Nanoarchaeota archaeon]
MKITQKNFDMFLEALNHRMTRIEEKFIIIQNDVKWIKKLGWFVAGILSAIFLALIGVIIKLSIGG